MATIRKRGNRWQVQVRRAKHQALTKSFLSRRDAEAWARQAEVEADRKALPHDPRHLQRYTLGDLVKRYRDTVTPLKKAASVETIVLNAFLRHPICTKRLSELGQADFASYRDERLEVVKPRSLQRMLSPIQNMFEVARHEWCIPLRDNPISRLKIVSECNRRERRLREGELAQIVEAAKKSKNTLIMPIVLFALETGLRRSEMLAARWTHVDLESRLLRLPTAKNGHSRTIPLSKAAISILKDLKGNYAGADDSKVFPTTINAFRLAWERLLRRADIQDLHFHDLRHEAISRFFELGLTAPEVALISGHRDMRMLFRYAHAQRQRIIEQLDKAMDEV